MIDIAGVGLTADDLDFSDLPPLRALPLDRPRWHRREWWASTEGESFHYDLPDFTSAADRAAFMVERMARTALLSAHSDVSVHDALFPYQGRLVSLYGLLAGIRRDAVDDLLDQLADDDDA